MDSEPTTLDDRGGEPTPKELKRLLQGLAATMCIMSADIQALKKSVGLSVPPNPDAQRKALMWHTRAAARHAISLAIGAAVTWMLSRF